MRYLIFVSHGCFAEGLTNALGMIVGTGREDILFNGMLDGMALDTYEKNLRERTAHITAEDEILLMGDLAGGSPLTRAAQVLGERGLLGNTRIIGGMNLPMAITAACADPDETLDEVLAEVVEGAHDELHQVVLDTPAEDSDDDI